MSTIIAARFKQQEQVQAAIAALQDAGYPEQAIASFYVNPPGQHDRYPLGGDHDKSEGAEETGKGMLTGGVAGAAVGLAAMPVVGPFGALVGAYVGSLLGGLVSTREADEVDASGEVHPHEHPSGMMVAVALAPAEVAQEVTQEMAQEVAQQGAHVLQLLHASGGFDAEVAQGHIEAGDWVDFDPLEAPQRIRGSA